MVIILAMKYYVGKCDYINGKSRDILTKSQERQELISIII